MALRNGFTTGTAAAAAALAAILRAQGGGFQSSVDAPLPLIDGARRFINIPVHGSGSWNGGWFAEVRKDGGSDPDATHGMIIRAEVFRSTAPAIQIDGGNGIGRARLPGLPIAVGEAAINPAPRRQIQAAVQSVASGGWRVVISAPEGERRARFTLNGRLGIIGGISILGTQGIVRPFSSAAWLAAIEQSLAVARACGARIACLASGRRSAAAMRRVFPHLPSYCFIEAGDAVKKSLSMAADFECLAWGCMFGKLAKLAQGCGDTHAHAAALDLGRLAEAARMPELAGCNTAQQALGVILERRPAALPRLVNLAKSSAERLCGRPVEVILFDSNGMELARA